jgi:mono/diheme cytochrome c family protein
LTDADYSLNYLGDVFWNGIAGTAMPSWRNLNTNELSELAACVLSLRKPEHVTEATSANLKLGQTIYANNCAQCHGPSGEGNGPAARPLLPAPANHRLKRPDLNRILQTLSDGIQGTSMPSMKDQLKDTEREAVAAYVQSLYQNEAKR